MVNPVDQTLLGQGGLITRAQSIRLGLSSKQITGRLKSGKWTRVGRGVYRLTNSPVTPTQRIHAATMSTCGLASHASAAELWGLDLFTKPKPAVTVAFGRRIRHAETLDVTVHHTRHWDLVSAASIKQQGVPCTGIEHTIIDCGLLVPKVGVIRLGDQAVRRSLTTWDRIEMSLDEIAFGRPGASNVRAAIHQQRIHNCPVPLSDFSRLVFQLLVDNGLPRPELEYAPVDEHGGPLLQLDLAWPQLSKAIECDGWQFHATRSDHQRDKSRRNALKARGWSILEITWADYAKRPKELVELVRRFLAV